MYVLVVDYVCIGKNKIRGYVLVEDYVCIGKRLILSAVLVNKIFLREIIF